MKADTPGIVIAAQALKPRHGSDPAEAVRRQDWQMTRSRSILQSGPNCRRAAR
jgi:hypothetical protein